MHGLGTKPGRVYVKCGGIGRLGVTKLFLAVLVLNHHILLL